MPKPFGLTFGALCDDIEVQLRRQGLTLGSDAGMVQRWVSSWHELRTSGLITNGESDRARDRLMKRITAMVQVFAEGADPDITTTEPPQPVLFPRHFTRHQ